MSSYIVNIWIFLCKWFLANFTFIWFFTSMNSFMFMKRSCTKYVSQLVFSIKISLVLKYMYGHINVLTIGEPPPQKKMRVNITFFLLISTWRGPNGSHTKKRNKRRHEIVKNKFQELVWKNCKSTSLVKMRWFWKIFHALYAMHQRSLQ